jgi:hypothetical protein
MTIQYETARDFRSYPIPFEQVSDTAFSAEITATTVSTLVIPSGMEFATIHCTIFALFKTDGDPVISASTTFVEDDTCVVGGGVIRGFNVEGFTDMRFVPAAGETGIISVEFYSR